MKSLRFNIDRSVVFGSSNTALLDAEGDIAADLREQIWQDLSTDIEITISGVTLFAAAWMDPGHWAEEWSEKLDCSRDEVPDRVAELLMSAIEER